MNPAGLVLAIAGMWVVAQVFAGNALERLNILKPTPTDSYDVIPDVAGGMKPYLPGGDKNPIAPNFPDLFPGGFGTGVGTKYL